MKVSHLQEELEKLLNWSKYGCGNHGCRIYKPKGMGTNGSCQCSPYAFGERMLYLASELEKDGKYGRFEAET